MQTRAPDVTSAFVIGAGGLVDELAAAGVDVVTARDFQHLEGADPSSNEASESEPSETGSSEIWANDVSGAKGTRAREIWERCQPRAKSNRDDLPARVLRTF